MSIESFVQENKGDLEALVGLFIQLLMSDFQTLSNIPSPILAYVLECEKRGTLKMKKELLQLISESSNQGVPFVTDGFGGSILRM